MYRNHLNSTNISKRKHKCEECKDTFTNKKTLNDHNRKHHTAVQIFKCHICQINFSNKRKLWMHKLKTHYEKQIDGEKTFTVQANDHITPDSELKTFKCSFC